MMISNWERPGKGSLTGGGEVLSSGYAYYVHDCINRNSIVFVTPFSILMYHNQHCILGLSLVVVDVIVVLAV